MKYFPFSSGDVTCDEEQLILDEAPLVYYYLKTDYWKEPRNNQGKDYVPCPLEGGYIMKWRDRSGKLACNDVLTTMKLENECSPGEGLVFNGLDSKCNMPHRKLKKNYFCLASWQENQFTFMVIYNQVFIPIFHSCG